MTTTASAQVSGLKTDGPGVSLAQELDFLAANPGSELLRLASNPEQILLALRKSLDFNDSRQADTFEVASRSIYTLRVTGAELTQKSFEAFIEAAALNDIEPGTTLRAAMRMFIYLRSQGGELLVSQQESESAQRTLNEAITATYETLAVSKFDLSQYEMLTSNSKTVVVQGNKDGNKIILSNDTNTAFGQASTSGSETSTFVNNQNFSTDRRIVNQTGFMLGSPKTNLAGTRADSIEDKLTGVSFNRPELYQKIDQMDFSMGSNTMEPTILPGGQGSHGITVDAPNPTGANFGVFAVSATLINNSNQM